MYPVLLRIGSFELHSWGVAFAVSLLTGIMVAVKRAPRFRVKPETVIDFTVVIIIAAIVGSRFWYVVYHINEFKGHWFDVVNPFQNGQIGIAGFSMIGGVVLSILASLVYAKVKKLNFLLLGDVIAPSFLLGAGIQRLGGCFLNGCCFGRPTESFLGVVFPPEGVAGSYFSDIPLWPTQLFASALGFVGFLFVLWFSRKYCFPGYTLWQVFAFYSIDRFTVDQFRYYETYQILGKVGPLTINVNHVVLLVLLIFCVFFWLKGWSTQCHKL